MLNFLRRNRVLLACGLGLLLAAGLAARAGRERGRGRTDPVRRVFLEAMAPLQRVTTAVQGAVYGTWRSVLDLWHAHAENAQLRAQTRALQEQLDQLVEVDLENARLRRLLDFRETLRGELVTARVIGHDATGLARTLVIDRGEKDGVVKGSAALTPEGIVGHVFIASGSAARVLLVSDHNSGVDALVQRSRVRGIVQGTASGGCALKYVKRTEDVQVGDMVVTSGLDGIFPKGLSIGQVVAVDKRGQGLFQSAEVRARLDFDRLEEVLVTRGPVTSVTEPLEGRAD